MKENNQRSLYIKERWAIVMIKSLIFSGDRRLFQNSGPFSVAQRKTTVQRLLCKGITCICYAADGRLNCAETPRRPRSFYFCFSIFFIYSFMRHSGTVVSTVATHKQGPEGWGLSVQSLYALPVFAWVLSECSGFLPKSKDMQLHRDWWRRMDGWMEVAILFDNSGSDRNVHCVL